MTIEATSAAAEASARLANEFVAKAHAILADHRPANGLLLRGFARRPDVPHFPDVYKMKSCAIATYPMYKGMARMLGMDVLEVPGPTIDDELAVLRRVWNDYQFFYFHIKATDTAGEDGDFARKVKVLEDIDAYIPALLEMGPDVMVVTGDHSTPAELAAHSWHPVPFVLCSRWVFSEPVENFSERACMRGELGLMPAMDAMGLMLGHALKLEKYGA